MREDADETGERGSRVLAGNEGVQVLPRGRSLRIFNIEEGRKGLILFIFELEDYQMVSQKSNAGTIGKT